MTATQTAPDTAPDPTGPADAPALRSRRPAGFGLMSVLGIADLAVDAVVLAVAGAVIAAAVGFGWVIGLAVLPWLLRGYGWFERHRTAAVYGIDLPELPRRRTPRKGFDGFLHQWWLDASDSTPWRSLGFLAVSLLLVTVFGALVLIGIGGGIGFLLAPVVRRQPDLVYVLDLPEWAFPTIGVAAIAIGVAAAIGYGYLDRTIAQAVLGVSDTAVMRRQVELLERQRSGAVAAAADQRRRIERDLHDEVQPRLVSIAMTLGMAKGRLDAEPEAGKALVEQAHAETKEAIAELRRLVQGFQPAVLADRGLDAALSALAARSPIPVTLDVDLPGGACSPEAEAVVYFAVSEALTNVAKHARATRCSVQVSRSDERLVATVTDDGVGGARPGTGVGGLAGMRERAIAAGGTVRVSSPDGGPSTVTVEVPCAS